MIQAQEIVDRVQSELDAEGSERYTWERDFAPSINNAKEWMVSLYNKAFAVDKLSEESLRELVYTGMWKVSEYSRFAYNRTLVGRDLWSIISIYVKPTYINAAGAVTLPDEVFGQYDDTRAFRSSRYSAMRLTMEEWNQRFTNPFVAGSDLMVCDELMRYAYCNFTDYHGEVYNPQGGVETQAEVEIAPEIPNEYIAMTYLSYPEDVEVITDTIGFPTAITNMLVQKVLNIIAIKEDAADLRQSTQQELNQLIQLMS